MTDPSFSIDHLARRLVADVAPPPMTRRAWARYRPALSTDSVSGALEEARSTREAWRRQTGRLPPTTRIV